MATFKYISGGTTYSKTITIKKTMGDDAGEDFFLHTPVDVTLLDGSDYKYVIGHKNRYTLTIITSDSTTLEYLLMWCQGGTGIVSQTINFGDGDVAVVLEDYSSEWLDGFKTVKVVTLVCHDKNVSTTTGTPIPDTIEDIDMYIIRNVEVTGTEASPQTVTFNASYNGGLDDSGSSWPTTLTDVGYVYTVEVVPLQDANIFVATAPSLSSGSVTCALAYSNVGNPKLSDSKYYCDVKLIVKVKV